MKEFIKIFLVLCAIVGAFFFGRNYGVETQIESKEFKTLKSDNYNNQNAQDELKNLKEKFQTLLDSSDLKKTDELLGKIMTIFLADLSLQLTEEKQKDFEFGKRICSTSPTEPTALEKIENKPEVKTESKTIEEEPVVEVKKHSIKNEAKFKKAELDIIAAEDIGTIRKALNSLELKKIDSLLDGAPRSTFQQSKKFFGHYRGSVIDVLGNAYGTMTIEIQNTPEAKEPISGKIKLFKGGEAISTSTFTTTEIGFSPENYQATIIDFGPQRFLQAYKLESSQKIAGILYERLPNGTTKTIGSFILSRTDFID